MTFLQFAIKYGDQFGKELIETATKTELEPLKTVSKNSCIKLLKQFSS